MEVFIFLLKRLTPMKRVLHCLLDRRLCGLHFRGYVGKGKNHAPPRNWTVDIQLIAHHLIEYLQMILGFHLLKPTGYAMHQQV